MQSAQVSLDLCQKKKVLSLDLTPSQSSLQFIALIEKTRHMIMWLAGIVRALGATVFGTVEGGESFSS